MNKKCKKCHHKCHCKDPLHADEYGICTCERCKCDEKKKDKNGVQNEL